jgi:linoleoyl-CoA desaturase
MAAEAVKFTSYDCDRFVEEVKRQVARYFDERNLSTKADRAMATKAVTMIAALLVPYGAVLTLSLPGWALLSCCVAMGAALAGIGFCVSHDALHGAYSHNPRVNTALGYSFDLLGANGYMWRITHNVLHHTYTNIHGLDEDLSVSPLLRLSPQAKHFRFHRFQHLYAPFAYSLSTLNWLFVKDFELFLRRRLGPYTDRRHSVGQVCFLVSSKAFVVLWTILVPLWVLDVSWSQFLLGFATVHLVGGTILGVVFQLAHIVEPTSHPVPDPAQRMPSGWLVHQMLTTANFSEGNRWLTEYVGGLNHQIEHHLFPSTCSAHYPMIAPIVRKVAAEHGIPYCSHPTFLGALGSHLKMLRRLGRGETSWVHPGSPSRP